MRFSHVFGTQTLSIDSFPPAETWCYAMSLVGDTGAQVVRHGDGARPLTPLQPGFTLR